MNRSLPTDPPEDPVNRIAGFLAPKVSAKAPSDSDSRLKSDLKHLTDLYKEDPEGNHTTQVVDFAKRYLGGVETALWSLAIGIKAKSPQGPMLECMVRDLKRHLSDGAFSSA